MNVRIIAGLYGGRVIDAPDRRSTHAMGERIRNAIFNSLGDEVRSAKVLDAFAGSGSIGIEAMSRGSGQVLFIEKDRIAAKIIQNNIDLLGIDSTKVIKTTVSNWLETSNDDNFDVIFADPPYHDSQISVVNRLTDRLRDGGLLVLSIPAELAFETVQTVELVSERVYGNAKIVVVRKRNGK